MHKKVILPLVLLLLLLCSCATATDSASSTNASILVPAHVKVMAAAPFRVVSVDMDVSVASVSTWACGSFVQVVYLATFHVVSGPRGGVMAFSYTLNNGRSQTPERLTILPGQRMTHFAFAWQGALPRDHTSPGPSGVMVSSPNRIVSRLILPAGKCR